MSRKGTQASLRERFSFVVNPPRLRPRHAASCPPFFSGTGCTRMSPNHRPINEDRRDFTSIVKMFMECLKDPRIAPSTEPAIDRVPISIDFRQSPPGGTLSGYPKHCREKMWTIFGVTDIDIRIRPEKWEEAAPGCITDDIWQFLRCICFWSFHKHIIPQDLLNINTFKCKHYQ